MSTSKDSDIQPLKRRIYLLSTAFVGVVLSLSAFFYSSVMEQKQTQARIESLADERLAQLKTSISATVEIIDSVGSFFDSHENVSREQFKVFTRPVLERHPELWGIHWIPRIKGEDRADFERRLRWQGFIGQITALRAEDNSMQPAASRSEYYPVEYSEPIARNRMIIGFDASSRSQNRQAMQKILSQGMSFASTAPFAIVQDKQGSSSIIFFRPVFGPEEPSQDPQERQNNIRGFIAALVKPQIILDALALHDQQTAMQMQDITDAPLTEAAQTNLEDIKEDWLSHMLTFSAMGRHWQFRLSIHPERLDELGHRDPNRSLLVLVSGLAFTFLLIGMIRDLIRTHRLAARERDRAQSYLDTVETMIIALDKDGYISLINRKACELLGCQEQDVISQYWFSERFLSEPDQEKEEFQQLVTGGKRIHQKRYSESKIRTSQGELLLIAWHNAIQYDSNGEFTGVLSAGEDITQQRRLQALDKIRSQAMHAALKGQPLSYVLEQVLKGIEEQKPDIRGSILLLDADGQHLLSGAAPSLPEAYNNAINGVRIGEGVGSCGTAAFRNERVIVEDIQNHPYWSGFKELAASFNLGSCWSEPVRGKNGRILGTFALYHQYPAAPAPSDIELIEGSANFVSMLIEQYQTEARLIQMANTDELTSLPNRRQFMNRLEQEFARSRRYKHPMALCMLDIDHFKRVNDKYGHAVGDQVLKELAVVVQDSLRETDLPGRLGGEEFAILLPDTDTDNASLVAERIRSNLEQMRVEPGNNKTLQLTVSIGVAVLNADTPSDIQPDELLSLADHCLYFAKQNGRNQVSFIATELA
ncbi:sensor domain-containing diguanylate cyclase [Oceanospirillum sediminis]|uniref:diguanylate cyclase n=1 Tax=Oceanospirillum sediminis TaxID=2760088 RepID=A0A839IVW5_9GAMM|nr:diguanylate cyclase [Oceanospirillum sediminis]MBB1488599.1 diguanylate cyclase [Oceanospirillum sediminis]